MTDIDALLQRVRYTDLEADAILAAETLLPASATRAEHAALERLLTQAASDDDSDSHACLAFLRFWRTADNLPAAMVADMSALLLRREGHDAQQSPLPLT